MLRSPDYLQVRAEAQRLANEGSRTMGIERCRELDGQTVFQVRYLPGPEHRFGHDLRMERVEPEEPADLEVEGWLCGCGNGSLRGAPPASCPLCGFCFEFYDLD